MPFRTPQQSSADAVPVLVHTLVQMVRVQQHVAPTWLQQLTLA